MTHPDRKQYPKIDGYDLRTVEGCSAAYRALRFYAVKVAYSSPFNSNASFDVKVCNYMDFNDITSDPAHWVACAAKVTWPCKRCASTGRFITHVENGVPRGPGGPCFRCDGKGVQTTKDAHRNYWYDVTQIVHI